MRFLCVCFFCLQAVCVWGQDIDIPEPRSHILDQMQLLAPEEAEQLNARLVRYEADTNTHIVIALEGASSGRQSESLEDEQGTGEEEVFTREENIVHALLFLVMLVFSFRWKKKNRGKRAIRNFFFFSVFAGAVSFVVQPQVWEILRHGILPDNPKALLIEFAAFIFAWFIQCLIIYGISGIVGGIYNLFKDNDCKYKKEMKSEEKKSEEEEKKSEENATVKIEKQSVIKKKNPETDRVRFATENYMSINDLSQRTRDFTMSKKPSPKGGKLGFLFGRGK